MFCSSHGYRAKQKNAHASLDRVGLDADIHLYTLCLHISLRTRDRRTRVWKDAIHDKSKKMIKVFRPHAFANRR